MENEPVEQSSQVEDEISPLEVTRGQKDLIIKMIQSRQERLEQIKDNPENAPHKYLMEKEIEELTELNNKIEGNID